MIRFRFEIPEPRIEKPAGGKLRAHARKRDIEATVRRSENLNNIAEAVNMSIEEAKKNPESGAKSAIARHQEKRLSQREQTRKEIAEAVNMSIEEAKKNSEKRLDQRKQTRKEIAEAVAMSIEEAKKNPGKKSEKPIVRDERADEELTQEERRARLRKEIAETVAESEAEKAKIDSLPDMTDEVEEDIEELPSDLLQEEIEAPKPRRKKQPSQEIPITAELRRAQEEYARKYPQKKQEEIEELPSDLLQEEIEAPKNVFPFRKKKPVHQKIESSSELERARADYDKNLSQSRADDYAKISLALEDMDSVLKELGESPKNKKKREESLIDQRDQAWETLRASVRKELEGALNPAQIELAKKQGNFESCVHLLSNLRISAAERNALAERIAEKTGMTPAQVEENITLVNKGKGLGRAVRWMSRALSGRTFDDPELEKLMRAYKKVDAHWNKLQTNIDDFGKTRLGQVAAEHAKDLIQHPLGRKEAAPKGGQLIHLEDYITEKGRRECTKILKEARLLEPKVNGGENVDEQIINLWRRLFEFIGQPEIEESDEYQEANQFLQHLEKISPPAHIKGGKRNRI
ncbi:MAG TPA: hypothetical protein VFQ60_01620 [Patescibacteria group bacterium]|nr:hypothetical protein [Patescibacteria group bacterium]